MQLYRHHCYKQVILILFIHLEVVETGVWTGWSRWSDCSLSCGKGRQSRKRSCIKSSTSQEWENGAMFRECDM